MTRPTMTLQECAEAMRAKGFRISPARIRDGLESGAYPFGRIVSVGVTGRKNTEIFRVMFEAWLREVCGEGEAPENLLGG